MAIPPADFGDHNAKLPVLEAEIEPTVDDQSAGGMPEEQRAPAQRIGDA